MPRKPTPTMQRALRHLYTGRYLLWRIGDIPGGASTVRALIKRGLLERNGQYLQLTDAGVQAAREGSMTARRAA